MKVFLATSTASWYLVQLKVWLVGKIIIFFLHLEQHYASSLWLSVTWSWSSRQESFRFSTNASPLSNDSSTLWFWLINPSATQHWDSSVVWIEKFSDYRKQYKLCNLISIALWRRKKNLVFVVKGVERCIWQSAFFHNSNFVVSLMDIPMVLIANGKPPHWFAISLARDSIYIPSNATTLPALSANKFQTSSWLKTFTIMSASTALIFLHTSKDLVVNRILQHVESKLDI